MKVFYILLLSVCCSFSASAQFFWEENFEAPFDAYRSRFLIDTNYHHNQWQIGKPSKTVFDSALSLPNAIVTDTLHPYAPSDTSVFIVYHKLNSYYYNFLMNFSFKLDIDSGAIAKVEVSGDSGVNWINVMTEDTTYQFHWGATKPRLDTSSHTWQTFQLGLNPWLNSSPGGPYTFPHYRTSDSLLFRFTFISDSDTTTKDGWMMDNFYLQNIIFEGHVSSVKDDNMVNVYPVPSCGPIYLHAVRPSNKASVIVYNTKGQEVYKEPDIPSSGILNLPLPNGNYVLKYSSGDSYALKRITILK